MFHGLPSNNVRALAQDHDGIIWIGTDAGLARFDGRQIAVVNLGESRRVQALHVDANGVLWVGTDAGVYERTRDEWRFVAQTRGASITAIASRERRIIFAASGRFFDCSIEADNSLRVSEVKDLPLLRREEASETLRPSSLEITSLAMQGDALLIGTRGRGVLVYESGQLRERLTRPRPFYVETLLSVNQNALWFGAQVAANESGLFATNDNENATRVEALNSGAVTALSINQSGDLWIGTSESGAFLRSRDGRTRHWTFENTGGGLVSNHINCSLVDREGIVWFGTNRGVCRYDREAVRRENIAAGAESNFIRTLYRTSGGVVLCGTNRGLFRYDDEREQWNLVPEFHNRTVHTIVEDANGNLLVGTASGLFAGERQLNRHGEKSGAGDNVWTFAEQSTRDNLNRDAASVRSLAVFRNQTYAAIFGRGIERLNFDGKHLYRTLINRAATNETREEALGEILSLHADESGLLIGTMRDGVFLFDGSNIFPIAELFALKTSPCGTSAEIVNAGCGWRHRTDFTCGATAYLSNS